MAPHVDKGIGEIRGKPVLKVGKAIIVRFNHFGFTDDKFAQITAQVIFAGHQRSPVKSLVIFNTDKKAFLLGFFSNLDTVLMRQDQRFNA